MANSIITYTGDGVTVQYAVNFTLGVLRREYVTCQVNNEVDGLGDPVYRDLEWVSDGLVNIQGDVPADDAPIVFKRTMPKTELIHDYSDGVPILEANLDESNLQTIMSIHEFLDGRLEDGFVQDIDMNGFKIINLGEGTDDTDAATVEQLNEATTATAADVVAAEAARVAAVAAKTSAETAETNAELARDEAQDILDIINDIPQDSPVTTYSNSYPRTIKDRFSNAVNAMDFIPVAERAAIIAGTSTYDVQAALSYAISEAIAAKVWRVYIPAGLWTFYSTNVSLPGNIHIFGDAEGTELRKHSTATTNFILKGSGTGTCSNVEIDNLLLTNQRTTASGTEAAINFDGADYSNIELHDLIYDSSTAFCNFAFFKAASGKTISNVASYRNNVLNCKRMGLEIINHDNTSNYNIVNVSSSNDKFINCGYMGMSISGPIKSVDISNTYFKDCVTNGLELVGPSACRVRGACFSGSMAQLFTGALGSSLSQGTGIVISDCTTEGTVTGRVELVNVGNVTVHDCTLDMTGVFSLHDSRTFKANIHNNNITTTASNVFICDNTGNNYVHHNRFDNSANGSVTAVMRGNNTGAVNNIFSDNILVKGTGGTHIDYPNSAVEYISAGNILTGVPQSVRDNYTQFTGQATVANGNTTSTCTITFDASSSWRPFSVLAEAVVTTTGGSGVSQGGAESKIMGRVVNSTTAVQISKTDYVLSANCILTTSYGTNSVTITATVTAGVQVGWNIHGRHHIGVAKPSMVFA